MKWNDRSSREMILQISELITSVILLAAVVLKYIRIWMDCFVFALPLLGFLLFLNGFLRWETDKDLAAFYLISAGFICLVCIAVIAM